MERRGQEVYEVEWTDNALKSLSKLDKPTERKIRWKVENELVKDPYPSPTNKNVKALQGELKGLYRYRCHGKYRVAYKILRQKLLITVLEVVKRSDVYPILERKYGR
ncbi:MAG: pirin [Mycoplasmataceae bacterium RV_VA103A]|nr:MAG: pirin [Mycoplasmataceae bacterium RV_VA103A]